MNLPARTEGPHCWLWLLLYAEAERDVGSADLPGGRTQAAGVLWARVVAGEVCVAHDRRGVLAGDADPWLPELVTAEARRHLVLSAQLDETLAADSPQRKAKAARPDDERIGAISAFIWRQLGNGWARVADEEDAILFWDPDRCTFVPFDLELSRRYARLFPAAS